MITLVHLIYLPLVFFSLEKWLPQFNHRNSISFISIFSLSLLGYFKAYSMNYLDMAGILVLSNIIYEEEISPSLLKTKVEHLLIALSLGIGSVFLNPEVGILITIIVYLISSLVKSLNFSKLFALLSLLAFLLFKESITGNSLAIFALLVTTVSILFENEEDITLSLIPIYLINEIHQFSLPVLMFLTGLSIFKLLLSDKNQNFRYYHTLIFILAIFVEKLDPLFVFVLSQLFLILKDGFAVGFAYYDQIEKKDGRFVLSMKDITFLFLFLLIFSGLHGSIINLHGQARSEGYGLLLLLIFLLVINELKSIKNNVLSNKKPRMDFKEFVIALIFGSLIVIICSKENKFSLMGLVYLILLGTYIFIKGHRFEVYKIVGNFMVQIFIKPSPFPRVNFNKRTIAPKESLSFTTGESKQIDGSIIISLMMIIILCIWMVA